MPADVGTCPALLLGPVMNKNLGCRTGISPAAEVRVLEWGGRCGLCRSGRMPVWEDAQVGGCQGGRMPEKQDACVGGCRSGRMADWESAEVGGF